MTTHTFVSKKKIRTTNDIPVPLPELHSLLKINPIGLLSPMLQFQENKELSIPKNRIVISQCIDQDRNSRYKKRWEKTKQSSCVLNVLRNVNQQSECYESLINRE